MSLKLRRGTDAQRVVITPAEGELIYTTDTKKLYVGDGSTSGGVAVDTSGSGITDLVQDTTPQLGGDLDVNSHQITSSSNGNISILPNGSGEIILPNSLKIDSLGNIEKSTSLSISPTGYVYIGSGSQLIDGNVRITRSTYSSSSLQGFVFSQHHNTPDAVNFTFLRSRGDYNNQSGVKNGDDLGEIGFVGVVSAGVISTGAVISATVEGTVTGSRCPTQLRFSVDDGVSLVRKAELSSSGVFKIDQLGSLTGTNINLPNTNTITIGDVRLSQDGLSSVNTNSNLSISANGTGQVLIEGLAWPSADGLSGQVLTTNGAGSLSWTTVSGGGGSSFSRTTVVGSTSSIGIGVSENVNITGASKGYLLYKIQVNEPAWVRIYVSDSARTADSSRAEGVDPAPGSGVIAEVITSSTNQVVLISPGTIGFNDEPTVDSTIFLRVTNKAYTTAITSTLTIVSLET